MNAVHQATVSFTSQNTGAGNAKRISKILKSCLILVCIVGVTMGAFVNIFSEPLLAIYSTDSAVIAAGKIRLLYVSGPYFLCGIMEVIMGMMRGLGYSIIPMIVSLSGACLFRIVWLQTIFTWYPSLEVLLLSYPISWILTSLIHFLTYFYARKHHPLFQTQAKKFS